MGGEVSQLLKFGNNFLFVESCAVFLYGYIKALWAQVKCLAQLG